MKYSGQESISEIVVEIDKRLESVAGNPCVK
jgi:hypothetical protein